MTQNQPLNAALAGDASGEAAFLELQVAEMFFVLEMGFELDMLVRSSGA